MATIESIKAKIQGLIEKANAATSREDTQLSPAVDALIAGYGSGGGGGGYIDVTELPTEDINEEAVYRLTEEKELTLWLAAYMEGAEINMPLEDFFTMAGMNSTLTLTVVSTLPDIMTPTIPGDNIYNCYILESTGIAYISYDGTSATAVPLGEEMLGPDSDKGWIDSADDIVIDTSTENASLYTILHGAQQGLFVYSDGWYELEKTLETTEKPTDPTVYCTTKNGEVVDWLQQLEAEAGAKIPFVDALPLDIDGIYVLNANGFVYLVSNGQAVEFTEILSGTNCGWVDSIDEIDTSKSDCLYALRGSKTDVIYKVGENGTTNEVYIHENDEWQGFVKGGGSGGGEEWFNDGKTHLWIEIAAEGRMDVPLCINQSARNCATIDWGDGSATETINSIGNVSTQHTYSSIGEYVITLDVAEGCSMKLGNGDGYCVLGSSSSESNSVYRSMLKRVEIGSGVTNVGTGAFYKCYSLNNVKISSGVTTIDGNAFYYCYSLANIEIPNSVTTIGNYAFYYCYSLNNVKISDNVQRINNYTFGYCYSLNNVKISSGVTTINDNAFTACYSLASIEIPNSVTIIQRYAFQTCIGMKFYDFTKHTAVPTLAATNVFSSIPSDCEIRVPMALVDEWKAATNWSTYADKIVGV